MWKLLQHVRLNRNQKTPTSASSGGRSSFLLSCLKLPSLSIAAFALCSLYRFCNFFPQTHPILDAAPSPLLTNLCNWPLQSERQQPQG